MSIAEQNSVPAAWYPDQTNPNQLRWWDGSDWTSDVRPLATEPVAPLTLPDPRHGLHAVAKPAQGFGHASAEQLRSWPAPSPAHRNEVPAPVTEMPREWATNSSVDAIKGWMAKPADPVKFIPSLERNDPASEQVEDLNYSNTVQPEDYFSEAPQFEAPRFEAPAPSPAAPVAFEAVPVAFDATPVTFDATPVTFDATPATFDATPAAEPAETAAPASYADWQPAVPGWNAGSVESISAPADFPAPAATTFAAAVEPPYPAPAALPVQPQVQPQAGVALTRRQLRELVGGPLTIGVEDE